MTFTAFYFAHDFFCPLRIPESDLFFGCIHRCSSVLNCIHSSTHTYNLTTLTFPLPPQPPNLATTSFYESSLLLSNSMIREVT